MRKNNPWFHYAKEDFDTIKSLQKTNLYRSICFHAQQTAEESLKAYLFAFEKPIPRIHDISRLFLETELEIPDNLHQGDLEFLSSIYIETRYPPDIGLLPDSEPNVTDVNRASKVAEIIFNLVKSIL